MMKGQLFVDGIDIYKQYGVYVTEKGWNDLISHPSLKSVDSNDWHEEDGIEPDLSNPVLDTKDIQMTFAVAHVHNNRYFDFVALLSDGAYHDWNCECFGRRYKLRLVSQPKLEYAHWLGTFTLKLADDFPMDGYTYEEPQSNFPSIDDYEIDDKLFTDYGVRVLQGSLSNVMISPKVKQNLLRNIPSVSGATYDGEVVTYEDKDVELTCLLRANTQEEMWRNYDALLYDLTRAGGHSLYVNALEQSFECYYKSCKVSEFNFSGKMWLKFALTLVFYGDCRIDEDDVVLATENNIVVYTEDDQYAIEMRIGRFEWDSMRLVNDRNTMRFLGDGNMRFNN